MSDKPLKQRIRNINETVLSDDWAVLTKYTYEYQRLDGRWETQIRQVYDRGDGATILPYDATRGTILLIRQLRFPAFMTGYEKPLIEACAGVLDDDDPETCVRREAEEELGYRLHDITRLYGPYMSPGSVSERVWFFTASYTADDHVYAGGGKPSEGEDIETLEMPLDEAYAMVTAGDIIDAKTIMLIQHLKLSLV